MSLSNFYYFSPQSILQSYQKSPLCTKTKELLASGKFFVLPTFEIIECKSETIKDKIDACFYVAAKSLPNQFPYQTDDSRLCEVPKNLTRLLF